ncbi:unnamed protein product [Cuscuta campestris]|uniref:Uncharacterized protein n=1 Tax=Cuscuta campestris TaxID=132261 RepID=A0A484KZJ1_9ASTE|nr:unnamed protein product [Cuscuta campestris]
MFDVRSGSKETLRFVVVSSHQGQAFLSGLPPSNRGWKDKYVSIKFPLGAFPFAQNAWGKRMKVQVKPREADDLAGWETTLRAGDATTRGPYNVGKWGVYSGWETDPELEIILTEVIPDAIPIRRVKGSKAPFSTPAGSLRPRMKKEKVVKFSSKFATPKIVAEEPPTAQPLSEPFGHLFSLDEQPAQSHQGTSQPIHSGELYINVDTMEFDNMLAETGHTSEAGMGGQQAEGGHDEKEASEEALQRKRRRTQVVDQQAQSSGAGKGIGEPRVFAMMVRSDEELYLAFCSDLQEVIPQSFLHSHFCISKIIFLKNFHLFEAGRTDWPGVLLPAGEVQRGGEGSAGGHDGSMSEGCPGRPSESGEGLGEAVRELRGFRKLYAKHEGLLKAAKEADEQAQKKIQRLEAEKAALQEEASRSAEEIARLGDELEKERAERASLAAAWAIQESEQFANRAIADRDAAIRLFQGLYKHEPSAKVIDEIGTFGFESGQYDERRALYGILQRRIQGFEPKAFSLPELHDEAPVAPFEGI